MHDEWINNLLEWLSNYEIIFTTITTVALSIMAIIVSIAQNKTAKRQAKLMEQQSELMNMQLLVDKKHVSPHISVKLKFVFEKDTQGAIGQRVIVENTGGEAYNLDFRTAVFWKVVINYPSGIKFGMIRINNYLRSRFYNNNTGLLCDAYYDGNLAQAANIHSEFNQIFNEAGIIAFITPFIYAKLSYDDIFNENHIDYYYLLPEFDGKKMSEEEGGKIFSNAEDSSVIAELDFWEIKPNDLINLI